MELELERNFGNARLFNMMKISEKMLSDYNAVSKLASCKFARNRSRVIDWIKKTLGVGYSDERDSSIQLFDKVVTISFAEDESKLEDAFFLYHVAAASIIISCKLSESNSKFGPVHFNLHFKPEDLRNFEREVLAISRCFVAPQCTPINFATYIMKINPIGNDINAVLNTVDRLISEFWEEQESILFMPSTIAISALLIAFSMLQIYCGTWLESIPDFCFPSATNLVFSQSIHYLDLDRCISAFERIPSLKEPQNSSSPTSVSEMHYLEEAPTSK